MQTTDVKIVNGTYRNIEIKDAVFPLVKEYKEGKNGNFITVDGSAVTGFPDRSIRIKVVNKSDFEMLEDGESVDSTEAAKVETDDEKKTVQSHFDLIVFVFFFFARGPLDVA